MSQSFNIGLIFYFMSKKGNFLEILYTHISTFHKIKMKTSIKNLRHVSLDNYPIYAL